MAAPSSTLRKLEHIISSAQGGSRVPSDARLAETLQVPRSTVSRLMARLAGEGKCIRVRGSGTFAPGQSVDDSLPSVPCRRAASEALADHLQEMIAGGRYRIGDVLPSVKSMCLDMGAGPPTAIRAYRMLVSRGLAIKAGKSYRVGTAGELLAEGSGRTVTYYIYGNRPPSSLYEGWGLGLAQAKMESELLRMGLRIEYEGYGAFEKMCRSRRSPELSPFSVLSFVPDTYLRPCAAMAQKLIRSRTRSRPSVLLVGDVPDSRPAPALVHTYARGNTATIWGRTLARFLFGRRLRRVVMFINSDRPTYRSFIPLLKIFGEHKLLDPRAEHRAVVQSTGLSGSPGRMGEAGLESRRLSERLLGKYPSFPISDLARRVSVVGDMAGTFDGVLDADAWLFARDGDAVKALDYCASKGIRVPRDLSIIGLSNDRQHLDRGITTCVEDWDTIGYQMAHALVGDVPVARTGRGFVRAAALMVERATTPGD